MSAATEEHLSRPTMIAVALAEEGDLLWQGHFGMAPRYALCCHDGDVLERRPNPHAVGRHHDDPEAIAALLPEAEVFLARAMGRRSMARLASQGVLCHPVDAPDLGGALAQHLATAAALAPFERQTARYEAWFEGHAAEYRSELELLAALVRPDDEGVEIGVGTGRFAAPLGLHTGVEPTRAMARIATARGLRVLPGLAESLPLLDASFDLALMVVSLCFVADPDRALREARRVLRPGGRLVAAIVDRDSPLGRRYLTRQAQSDFYRQARFLSARNLEERLQAAGLHPTGTWQTLFTPHPGPLPAPQEARPGHGEGGFVAMIGEKP